VYFSHLLHLSFVSSPAQLSFILSLILFCLHFPCFLSFLFYLFLLLGRGQQHGMEGGETGLGTGGTARAAATEDGAAQVRAAVGSVV
jgi:hypothetical protein